MKRLELRIRIPNSKVGTKYKNQIIYLHYEKLNHLVALKVLPSYSSKRSLYPKVTLLVVEEVLIFLLLRVLVLRVVSVRVFL